MWACPLRWPLPRRSVHALIEVQRAGHTAVGIALVDDDQVFLPRGDARNGDKGRVVVRARRYGQQSRQAEEKTLQMFHDKEEIKEL